MNSTGPLKGRPARNGWHLWSSAPSLTPDPGDSQCTGPARHLALSGPVPTSSLTPGLQASNTATPQPSLSPWPSIPPGAAPSLEPCPPPSEDSMTRLFPPLLPTQCAPPGQASHWPITPVLGWLSLPLGLQCRAACPAWGPQKLTTHVPLNWSKLRRADAQHGPLLTLQ